MGYPAAMASPLAALTPTRRALNGPGPKATATPSSSAADNLRDASTSATAGINWVVWLAVECQSLASTTAPSASDKATPP